MINGKYSRSSKARIDYEELLTTVSGKYRSTGKLWSWIVLVAFLSLVSFTYSLNVKADVSIHTLSPDSLVDQWGEE